MSTVCRKCYCGISSSDAEATEDVCGSCLYSDMKIENREIFQTLYDEVYSRDSDIVESFYETFNKLFAEDMKQDRTRPALYDENLREI